MATDKLRVTELDFDTIKTNLKNFFADQTEFTDYDFSGSGLSILLDVLAYNTHYMAYYLNMVANEMYLDSATQRDSVVSLAKQLGYTPRSKTSATATVNLSMVEASGVDTDFVKIPAYTQFNVTSQGKSYTFYTLEDKTIVWSGSASGTERTFSASNLSVTQGSKLSKEFTFTGNKNQRYILDNPGIDTSTLSVKVRASAGVNSFDTFTKYDGLLALNSTSAYYFVDEVEGQGYEISFGDGVYGKKLSAGNVIMIDYLTSDGNDANGLTGLTLSSASQGWGEDSNGSSTNITVTVTTATASSGGGDSETIDSIKYLAPQSYQHQNRAVTVEDYKAILSAKYSNIASLRVWGGETPEGKGDIGTVFICIKPITGEQLSDVEKENVKTILDPYKVIGIKLDLKDYTVVGLKIDSSVKYNPSLTTEKGETIKLKVIDAIKNYNTNRLGRFDGVFRYSQLVGDIDDADKSILSNSVEISLIKPSKTIEKYTPYTSFTSDAVNAGAITYQYADPTVDTFRHLDQVKPSFVTFNDITMKKSLISGGFSSSEFELLGRLEGDTGKYFTKVAVKLVDVPDENKETGIVKIVSAKDGTTDVIIKDVDGDAGSTDDDVDVSNVATINYADGKVTGWKPFPIISTANTNNTVDFIGKIDPVDIDPVELEILDIKTVYTNVTITADFDK